MIRLPLIDRGNYIKHGTRKIAKTIIAADWHDAGKQFDGCYKDHPFGVLINSPSEHGRSISIDDAIEQIELHV